MVTRSSRTSRTRSGVAAQPATKVSAARELQRRSTRNASAARSDESAGNNEDEYEVESIIDMTTTERGGQVVSRKFLVAWVGYEEQTWEPEANLPVAMVTDYVRTLTPPPTSTSILASDLPSVVGDNHRSSGIVQAITSDDVRTHMDATLPSVVVTNPDEDVLAPSTGRLTCNDHLTTASHPRDQNDALFESEHEDVMFPHVADTTLVSTVIGAVETRLSVDINTAVDTAATIGKASHEDFVDDGDAYGAEEYEIEAIVQMETETENEAVKRKFLVSWVGYEDQTWEPEDNLPSDMVSAYLRTLPSAPETSSKSTRVQRHVATPVCAACGDGPDGLGSACARCGKPMHHFCATEVCESLDLKDENGDKLYEFPNDLSYCSGTCYSLRPGAIRAAKKKRVRKTTELSESEFDDDDEDGDEEERERGEGESFNTKKKTKSRGPKKCADMNGVDGVPKAKRARTSKSKKTEPAPEVSFEAWPPRKPKKLAEKAPAADLPKDRDPLLGRMVAFCADKEAWMTPKLYKEAKGLYLSGRIHRPKVKGKKIDDNVYEVRWTVTNYQGKKYFHTLSRQKVEEGIQNHTTLSGGTLNKATWRHICRVPDSEARENGENLDDYVILDGTSDVFLSEQIIPENLQLVEQITQLDFQPSRRMQEPPDLFVHEDGTVETKLIKEKRHHFETASSSFFAYLPLSFWNTVVKETNDYANSKNSKGKAVTLDDLLRFFGIMFYMTIVDKGEYSNYWGEQVEDEIFGLGFGFQSSQFGLDKLMTLKRFQYIRKNLCFRCTVTPTELKKDPVARIRPLLNMLKYTSTKYVVVGRNVAVDESSIACRSKFGRHLIVYNSSKPTGKFHFKIYACCCATTWLMVGFRLHCSSDLEDRLKDVIPVSDARYLDDRLQFSSSVRQIVLEVTQPFHNTHRVVNTDNFYTSVTLLLSLRDVGLYGRGTIRENSAHFPKAHMFAKKAAEPRGSSLQGVSNTGQIIAASWMDGSAVNIISNADSSDMGEVTRLIGKEHVVFPAPKCVSEYNKHMQGVDRLDQLRAKYSIADGHSMQKWHKKLALAFIDIARVNAYVTKCMRRDSDDKPVRNQHRQFMIELASELITGKWKESVEDEGMLFADEQLSTATMSIASSPSVTSPSQAVTCDFVLSKEKFPNATRGKRGCKVCAFEGRPWTMKSLYCVRHNVCVCTGTYPIDPSLQDVACPRSDWTCWRKYHEYYLPRGVFNEYGRIMRSSKIFQARRKLRLDTEDQAAAVLDRTGTARALSPEVDVYSPLRSAYQGSPMSVNSAAPESPPTLVFSPFDGVRANNELGIPSRTSQRVEFLEYRSPREIESGAPSSDDFPGMIVEL